MQDALLRKARRLLTDLRVQKSAKAAPVSEDMVRVAAVWLADAAMEFIQDLGVEVKEGGQGPADARR